MHLYYDNIGDTPGYDTYSQYKNDPAHTFIKLTAEPDTWWDYKFRGGRHLHFGTARNTPGGENLTTGMELAGKAEYVFDGPDFDKVEFHFNTNRRPVTIGRLKDGSYAIHTGLPGLHGHLVRISPKL